MSYWLVSCFCINVFNILVIQILLNIGTWAPCQFPFGRKTSYIIIFSVRLGVDTSRYREEFSLLPKRITVLGNCARRCSVGFQCCPKEYENSKIDRWKLRLSSPNKSPLGRLFLSGKKLDSSKKSHDEYNPGQIGYDYTSYCIAILNNSAFVHWKLCQKN